MRVFNFFLSYKGLTLLIVMYFLGLGWVVEMFVERFQLMLNGIELFFSPVAAEEQQTNVQWFE